MVALRLDPRSERDPDCRLVARMDKSIRVFQSGTSRYIYLDTKPFSPLKAVAWLCSRAPITVLEPRKTVLRNLLNRGDLTLITDSLRQLFAEERFVTLLRAEGITTMPGPIEARLDAGELPFDDDVLSLAVASAYVRNLIAKAGVERYLSRWHQETLEQLRTAVGISSLT